MITFLVRGRKYHREKYFIYINFYGTAIRIPSNLLLMRILIDSPFPCDVRAKIETQTTKQMHTNTPCVRMAC